MRVVGYPDIVLAKVRFKPKLYTFDWKYFYTFPPTNLYKTFLMNKRDYDGCSSFRYLGRMSFHPGKFTQISEPLINPLLLPIVLNIAPDLLEGNRLKDNPYIMTARYPLAEYVSISKYGNVCPPFRKFPYRLASLMLSDCFAAVGRQPWLDVDSAFQWCERQTSPGFPWCLVWQKKAPILDSDFFKTWYVSWENRVRVAVANGDIGPWVFWKAFIKKELKKLSDVYAHNPRTILASPLEFTILGYRLFGMQNDRLARLGANFEIPCWIGGTKFHLQWHLLAQLLLRFPNQNDGDARRFDGTLQQRVFTTIRQLRDSWSLPTFGTTEDAFINRLILQWFYENVVNSTIVGISGDVFKKLMGQPSGQPNTLSDNGIAHCLYWFYHWCVGVVPYVPGLKCTWASFKLHVCLVVMGDDVIYSYSDLVRPYMLPFQVYKTFESFGVGFKSSVMDRPARLEELEFCSTGFKQTNGLYVPFLKRDKLLASIFYKTNDSIKLTLARLLALRVECYWNEDIFLLLDQLVREFIIRYEWELKKPPTMNEPTYEQLLELNWGDKRIRSHYLRTAA